jgi:GTPase SAR1 family protein
MGELVDSLWKDAAFKQVAKGNFPVSYEEGLNDYSASLFETNYAEIFRSSYWSTIKNEDLLNIRKPTQAIDVFSGKFNNEIFNLKDVGGQIHQRSKWPGAFANATAVMFIVSLMDVLMDGDDGENRLVNSQKIFTSICGASELKDVPCCVIFNKTDLFKEAIKTRSIAQCPQFKDVHAIKDEPESAKFNRYLSELKSFFRQGYDAVHNGHDVNEVQFYATCATDDKAVQEVISKLLTELNKLSLDAMMK